MEKQYRDASNLNARIALHTHFSTNQHGWVLWLFDQLSLPPDARVLEIGCGTGKLWAENLHRLPESWNITLTDSSPGMLREAEENLGKTGRFRFQVADARELPFEDGTFDGVIANHVLHHVPERRRAISETARVLADNGATYTATGGRRHMREMNRMVQILDPAHPDNGLAARSIGGFSLDNGAEQLSPHFPDVSLWRYEDALVVAEAQPLVDYVLSAMAVQEAIAKLPEAEVQARVSRLTEILEREINDRGTIHISKDTGLFVARK